MMFFCLLLLSLCMFINVGPCFVMQLFMSFWVFPNVSWTTSESRVRLARCKWFKPFSNIFYLPFQGGTSFVELL